MEYLKHWQEKVPHHLLPMEKMNKALEIHQQRLQQINHHGPELGF